MKKLLLIFALLFSTAMSSSPVRAEWTEVSKNVDGTIFYVDLEKIKKQDGYVYFWELINFLEPIGDILWSAKVYIQADCKLFKHKSLSGSFYKEPMGMGTADTVNSPDKDWFYPPPNSLEETILKKVCSQ